MPLHPSYFPDGGPIAPGLCLVEPHICLMMRCSSGDYGMFRVGDRIFLCRVVVPRGDEPGNRFSAAIELVGDTANVVEDDGSQWHVSPFDGGYNLHRPTKEGYIYIGSSCTYETIHEVPEPLSSIHLTWTCSHKSMDLESQPLLQSCLKRQLVGTCFGQGGRMTSRIRLQCAGDEWEFSIRTTSSRRRVTDFGLSLILPSTRITLFPNDQAALQVMSNQLSTLQIQPSTPMSSFSPVQQLIDTSLSLLAKSGDVPRGYLLTGPAGVGKTYSVREAVVQLKELANVDCVLTVIRGSELMAISTHPNNAASLLEAEFTKTAAKKETPHVGIVYLDEIDALVSKDKTYLPSLLMEATLCSIMDRVNLDAGLRSVLVVAATNRAEQLPPSLRVAGRFDREITIPPPDAQSRLLILSALATQHGLECHETILRRIAEDCIGYVPADLQSLVHQAALNMIGDEIDTEEAFRMAMKIVGASAVRDSALTAPPKMSWNDVSGDPGGAKTLLRQAIEWPRTRQKGYEALGITPPRGILLHGPPGCAKTTLARAAAGASATTFLSFSPADVFSSSYVGEAEAVIRRAFALARSAAPCILFFDEVDAILGSEGPAEHGMGRSSGSAAEARVLSTFLNEMDGIDGSWKDGVLVLGATNRPSAIDAALLRPGRFDKIIYVPAPDMEGRRAIVEALGKRWDVTLTDQDLHELASDTVTGKMTGAEIYGAFRETVLESYRERKKDTGEWKVDLSSIYNTLGTVKPLLSDPIVLEEYERFERNRKSSR